MKVKIYEKETRKRESEHQGTMTTAFFLDTKPPSILYWDGEDKPRVGDTLEIKVVDNSSLR